MAGGRQSRGKTKASGTASTAGRGRSKRGPNPDSVIPEVYRDMLAENAQAGSSVSAGKRRPVKKRRVEEPSTKLAVQATEDDHHDNAVIEDVDISVEGHLAGPTSSPVLLQQIFVDESDESDGSEMDWEDVDFNSELYLPPPESEIPADHGSITIIRDQNGQKSKGKQPQKRGITAIERRVRHDVHKMHILCLLVHAHFRNHLCNDAIAQATLRRLLTPKIVKFLNPDLNMSQFQRHQYFTTGLNEIAAIWKNTFKVIAKGMQRCFWTSDREDSKIHKLPLEIVPSINRFGFQAAAVSTQGSADTGAMLFCALLRSAGVDARLVCSLQVLPLGTSGQSVTPRKTHKQTVYANTSSEEESDLSNDEVTGNSIASQSSPTKQSQLRNPRRRLGGANFVTTTTLTDQGVPRIKKAEPKLKLIPPPAYPVLWVEAFDLAHQRWISLDTICTKTVGKVARFEPPQSDPETSMSYVIAFEEDGVASDVTRRYTKAYNAKTRKSRIESIEGGDRWWKQTMRLFRRRSGLLDREQVEAAELAKREASEGMPKNVQDFKGHPYYVLERHLRKNEVLSPYREVGKVNAGTAASGRTESVFRRKDVHVVRSADKWFRLGREIKQREQPLKFATPKKQKSEKQDAEPADIDEEPLGAGLYAFFQTKLYVPPPVVRGRVPRNAYGNLDIYVPSMIPAGAVHIAHTLSSRAARLLNVDYADAVTGFDFKGRIGTAVIQGIILAAENADALYETIDGLERAQEEAQNAKRRAEALRMWKRFLIGLRIVERVNSYGEDDMQDVRNEIDEQEEAGIEADTSGGFLPDSGGFEVTQPKLMLWDDGLNPREDFLSSSRLTNNMAHQSKAGEASSRRQRYQLSLTPSQLPKAPLQLDGEGGGFFRESSSEDQGVDETYAADMEIEEGDFALSNTNGPNSLQDETMTAMSKTLASADAQENVAIEISNEPERELDSVEQKDVAEDEQNLLNRLQSQDGKQAKEPISSDEDRGSMLSHDPDDDDAEPEWLQEVDSD